MEAFESQPSTLPSRLLLQRSSLIMTRDDHDPQQQFTYDPSLDIDRIVRESERAHHGLLWKTRAGSLPRASLRILSAHRTPEAPCLLVPTSQRNSARGLEKSGSGTATMATTQSRTRSKATAAQETIQEEDQTHDSGRRPKRLHRRVKSQPTLIQSGKMRGARDEREVKKLKQMEKYRGLPNHLFYMDSPYGDLLNVGAELPEFRIRKHRRSKSQTRSAARSVTPMTAGRG